MIILLSSLEHTGRPLCNLEPQPLQYPLFGTFSENKQYMKNNIFHRIRIYLKYLKYVDKILTRTDFTSQQFNYGTFFMVVRVKP